MDKIINSLTNESKKTFKSILDNNLNIDIDITKNLFIKSLYKNLKKNYDLENNFIFDIKFLNLYDFNIENYKLFLDNKFIHKNIYNSINKDIKKIFTYNYNNISIKIFTKINKINNYIINLITKFIINSSILINITNNKDKNINIFYFDLKKKKKFPSKKKILDSNNVNSGLTFISNYHSKIIIFRNEEFEKVLIHELLHYLGIDSIFFSNNLVINNNIFKNYCLNYYEYDNINVNETYIEFLTLTINLLLIIIKNNVKLENINFLYKYELIYSLDIVKKIIDYYDYDLKIIKRKKNCNEFRQKSNILSYYIFKTSLLFNLGMTLNYFYMCTKNLKIINFKCLKSFINLIDECMNNLYFNIIKSLNVLKNKKNKSLKMTLFEMK